MTHAHTMHSHSHCATWDRQMPLPKQPHKPQCSPPTIRLIPSELLHLMMPPIEKHKHVDPKEWSKI